MIIYAKCKNKDNTTKLGEPKFLRIDTAVCELLFEREDKLGGVLLFEDTDLDERVFIKYYYELFSEEVAEEFEDGHEVMKYVVDSCQPLTDRELKAVEKYFSDYVIPTTRNKH